MSNDNPHYRPEHNRALGEGHTAMAEKLCHCCGRDVHKRFLHFMTDVSGRVWCAMCMEFALSRIEDIDKVREHVAKGPPVEGAFRLEKFR